MALRLDSVEPIVWAAIASTMLFPWRLLTRPKCSLCGSRTSRRRQPCATCFDEADA
jgi:hypothetical protein